MKIKLNSNWVQKSTGTLALVSVLSATSVFADIKPTNDIRVNQHGYLPNQPKIAVYVGPGNTAWSLKDKMGATVANGLTSTYGHDNASGDSVSHIDFSSYQNSGKELTLQIDDKVN